MADCERCGQNHYDMSRQTVPTCPFKPFALGPSDQMADAEIARQLRNLLNAYPLATMDWPLDLMSRAATALERRTVGSSALLNAGSMPTDSSPPDDRTGGAEQGSKT